MEEEEYEEEIEFIGDNETRDINRQVIVSDRIFSNYLTLSELIAIVTRRADMIKMESPIYIESSETDTHKLALLELVQGRMPLSIEKSRGVIKGVEYIEIFDVNEMIITKKCLSSISSIINLKDNSLDLKDEIRKLLNEPN